MSIVPNVSMDGFDEYTPLLNDSRFGINLSQVMTGEPTASLAIVETGQQIYTYCTPVILFVGIFGHTLSLLVFLSKNLRGLSASRYLAALSIADLFTLVFYVLCEWLHRGLPYLSTGISVTFLEIDGLCQLWLYVNYLSRFLSAWLTVCFTVERFVGVCMPFSRINMGSVTRTTKIIASVFLLSSITVLYKPFLSGVYTYRGKTACTSSQNYLHEAFILDSIYALLIIFVPFIVITILNTLIVRTLYIRNKRNKNCLITTENQIGMEFTFILLVISIFFVTFNLPYFVIWCRTFVHSIITERESPYTNSIDYWTGWLSITRTIFYMNYCCNFFLYSITGGYFRREVVRLFKGGRGKYPPSRQPSTQGHEMLLLNNRNSWV